MKRLVIDARMVGPRAHGIARYTTRLAEGLVELRDRSTLPYEVVFLVSGVGLPSVFSKFKTLRAASPFLHPRELLEIPKLLAREKADLYHSPSFSSLITAPCPWIVTIHDLNHLTYGGVKEKLYYRLLLKPFARRAKKVMTVSQFSRQEISAWLGVEASQIALAMNALDPLLKTPPSESQIAETLKKFGLTRGRYFFCLSNPKPHKNIPRLVQAYAAYRVLHEKKPGEKIWDLALSMEEYGGAPGVKCLKDLDDSEIKNLIEACGAVVFPSLYEGFGLPPLEAAALGRLIIVSHILPHHEALQDLSPEQVRWVDPEDSAAWTRALFEMAQSPGPGADAPTRDKIWERFSSRRLAHDVDQIYQSVL